MPADVDGAKNVAATTRASPPAPIVDIGTCKEMIRSDERGTGGPGDETKGHPAGAKTGDLASCFYLGQHPSYYRRGH